jgi:hypothetical protein
VTRKNQFEELAEMELRDPDALYHFCDTVRDLCRDLSWGLQFQSEMLQADLSTVKVPEGRFGSLSSKARAKAVSWCLRQAADAVLHAGRLSVKTYSLFKRYYLQPEEPAASKPRFKLPA